MRIDICSCTRVSEDIDIKEGFFFLVEKTDKVQVSSYHARRKIKHLLLSVS